MSRPEEDRSADGDKKKHPGRDDEATATLHTNDIDGSGDVENDSIEEVEKGNGTPSSSTSSSTSGDGPPPSRCRSFGRKVAAFYWEHEFLILVIASIGLARAYPPLGAIYVAPDITASWIAVIFIFLLAGLSLKTSEFSRALENVKFNVFVQVFSFGVVSSIVYGLSKLLILGSVLDENLANGMTIAASLPMTISMVLVMTKAAGGDEAAAVFNSAFGNLVGVFLSPALILGYLGVTGNVNVGEIFYKLTARVVLPVIVGQVIQYTSKAVVDFLNKYKTYNRQAQQYALVFIVYTVFAEQFMEESQTSVGSVFIMIAIVFLILIALMVLAWYSLKLLFPDEPKLRVMGLFGGTHKTVAMGLPLISAIYDGNPNIGLYSLPLLCWHPLQLVLGTLIAPRLLAFVEREEARLGSGSLEPPREGTADGDEVSSSPVADTIGAAEEGRAPSSLSTGPGNTAAVASTLMKGSMDDEDVTDSSR